MRGQKKQRLELTWIGKERRPRLEPRILLEDKKKSYHAAHRVTGADCFDNMLIHGDNLLALKALEADYAGKVKCIYIDPPYNTGSAFQHYDDGLEHSIWLTMMQNRLELLKSLLSDDGSIWIQLDDNEFHYAKVLCDEILGRSNFITSITWHKKRGKDNSSRYFSITHDYILVYSKDSKAFHPNRLNLSDDTKKAYKNSDNDPRGNYRLLGLWSRQQGGSEYEYIDKKGKKYEKRLWLVGKKTMEKLDQDNRLVSTGDKLYRKLFLHENKGSISETIWTDASNNANAKDELKKLFGQKLFDTPKPEPLMSRIIEIATKPGDLVLDSFAGSGTTGAVAHKMNRRWIMVELGEHCHTHILPRLKKVVDGDDPGGITKSADWKGGGGFRYYTIAPSLLKKDKWGRYVVNKAFNPEMLSQALCKQAGFIYDPSPDIWWQHGHSSERDFIYATTQTFTHAQLAKLSEEIGDDRSLFIYCGGFKANLRQFANLTVRKIPPAILKNCEWDRDDYSLEVQTLAYASGTQAKMAFSDDK